MDTGTLVDLFVESCKGQIKRVDKSETNAVHEAGFLKLDNSKIKKTFGWKPVWHINEAVKKTVEWSEVWILEKDVDKCMKEQIRAYFGEE